MGRDDFCFCFLQLVRRRLPQDSQSERLEVILVPRGTLVPRARGGCLRDERSQRIADVYTLPSEVFRVRF